MIHATALLLSIEDRSAWAYGATVKIAHICTAILATRVKTSARVPMKETIVNIAEEMFDLSNNPSRHDERFSFYGNSRSVSVGDVIKVEYTELPTEYWLCMSSSWKRIDLEGGCEWVAPPAAPITTKPAAPEVGDRLVKRIAELGYIQREEDGKIVHSKDKGWGNLTTTFDNMEDLIKSALTLYTATYYK